MMFVDPKDLEDFKQWLLKVRGYPPYRVKKIIRRIIRISLIFDVYHTKPEEFHGFGRGRVAIKRYRATLKEFHKFLQNRELLQNPPTPQIDEKMFEAFLIEREIEEKEREIENIRKEIERLNKKIAYMKRELQELQEALDKDLTNAKPNPPPSSC